MIYETKGDLTKVDFPSIIAHQVNPVVLGPVLADNLATAYPTAKDDFYSKAKVRPLRLGDIQLSLVIPSKDVYVAHCCGQITTTAGGANTRQEAVLTYLNKLRHIALGLGLPVLLPRFLGSGQGGGNWTSIKQLIITSFKEKEVSCYIVAYEEGLCPSLEVEAMKL